MQRSISELWTATEWFRSSALPNTTETRYRRSILFQIWESNLAAGGVVAQMAMDRTARLNTYFLPLDLIPQLEGSIAANHLPSQRTSFLLWLFRSPSC